MPNVGEVDSKPQTSQKEAIQISQKQQRALPYLIFDFCFNSI